MAECLVGMLEADAAVHGRQRRLRGQRDGFVGPDVFTACRDEPDIATGRADGVRIVEQSGTEQLGDLGGGQFGVGVVQDGRDRDEHVGVVRVGVLRAAVRFDRVAQLAGEGSCGSGEVEHGEPPHAERYRGFGFRIPLFGADGEPG